MWEEWMWVVYNLWGRSEYYGHIGIIASGIMERDGEMWYMVISSNSKGDEKLRKEFVSDALIASTWWGFIPTKDWLAPTAPQWAWDMGDFTYVGKPQTEQSFDPNKFPEYRDFIVDGKTPTGMKSWTPEYEEFTRNARNGFLEWMKPVVNAAGLQIADENTFLWIDKDTRKTINQWIASIPAFESSMDKLIELVDEYGTERLPTNARQQMRTLYNDAMLQAKEIYNLWVLNWPDLEIMEAVIPNPTARWAKYNQMLWMWVSYKQALTNAKESVQWVAESNARLVGLEPITQDATWTQQTTQETAPQQILQTPEEQQEYNELLEMMNSLPQS